MSTAVPTTIAASARSRRSRCASRRWTTSPVAASTASSMSAKRTVPVRKSSVGMPAQAKRRPKAVAADPRRRA